VPHGPRAPPGGDDEIEVRVRAKADLRIVPGHRPPLDDERLDAGGIQPIERVHRPDRVAHRLERVDSIRVAQSFRRLGVLERGTSKAPPGEGPRPRLVEELRDLGQLESTRRCQHRRRLRVAIAVAYLAERWHGRAQLKSFRAPASLGQTGVNRSRRVLGFNPCSVTVFQDALRVAVNVPHT
jgi:hypothetical protein